jgi:hypothetical protein
LDIAKLLEISLSTFSSAVLELTVPWNKLKERIILTLFTRNGSSSFLPDDQKGVKKGGKVK